MATGNVWRHAADKTRVRSLDDCRLHWTVLLASLRVPDCTPPGVSVKALELLIARPVRVYETVAVAGY